MITIDLQLNDAVLHYRTRMDLTQKQLADLCGVSLKTIYNIETGKAPKIFIAGALYLLQAQYAEKTQAK